MVMETEVGVHHVDTGHVRDIQEALDSTVVVEVASAMHILVALDDHIDSLEVLVKRAEVEHDVVEAVGAADTPSEAEEEDLRATLQLDRPKLLALEVVEGVGDFDRDVAAVDPMALVVDLRLPLADKLEEEHLAASEQRHRERHCFLRRFARGLDEL